MAHLGGTEALACEAGMQGLGLGSPRRLMSHLLHVAHGIVHLDGLLEFVCST